MLQFCLPLHLSPTLFLSFMSSFFLIPQIHSYSLLLPSHHPLFPLSFNISVSLSIYFPSSPFPSLYRSLSFSFHSRLQYIFASTVFLPPFLYFPFPSSFPLCDLYARHFFPLSLSHSFSACLSVENDKTPTICLHFRILFTLTLFLSL